MHRKLCGRLPLAVGFLCLLGARDVAAQSALEDEACHTCHGRESILESSPAELLAMVRQGGEERPPPTLEEIEKLYIPPGALAGTAHVSLRCVDCHRTVDRVPHDRRLPAVDCGACHETARDELAAGPHGATTGREGTPGESLPRPGCHDCHGDPHQIAWMPRTRTHASAVASVAVCTRCHGDDRPLAPTPARTYRENVHGEALYKIGLRSSATCVDCHGAHGVFRPTVRESPLHPLRVSATCARCHEGIETSFVQSIHGQRIAGGDQTVATCTNCHDSHGIGVIDERFLASVVEECSHCHIELGRSYVNSYHGKATRLGHPHTPTCASCHGAHDILPASDPRSHVARENLATTCGACHEHVNEGFLGFNPHADHRDREGFPEVYYTWIVMTTLLLGVLAVFVPHAILWTVRETIERLRHRRRRPPDAESDARGGRPPAESDARGGRPPATGQRLVQRFRPIHRWTHLLIVISFMGLVATGFPLKYSDTDWARGLSAILGGAEEMALLHRIFAIMTFVYAGLHLAYLAYFLVRRCPRPRLKFFFGPDSLVLMPRDLRQFWQMLKWFVFAGPKPRFDRWTYLEKFDYWGEIWGVIVIGGSGLILWFPIFFTQWFPGWLINCALVVHSIEALLAASVIFIVHFLNTHLRPDKFPVDMVMLTGYTTESELREERPAEYERLVATGELERRIVPPISPRRRLLGLVGGILAFLCGLTLIVLAALSEFGEVL